MIRGYKAYKKGLINQFGEQHEIGQIYETDDIIYEKKGFYFCPYLEDTLRFYNGLEEDIDIAIVEGYGRIREFYDSYYDIASIASTGLRVLSVLTREEIINYALKLNELRMCKFLAGYRLSPEEIELFKNKGERVTSYIEFYQQGNQDAFVRRLNARRTNNNWKKI